MQVIFLSPHCDPKAALGEPDSGGQCVYEHELAKVLSRRYDLKIKIFTRDIGLRDKVEVINDNYEIHRISIGPRKWIPKEELDRYILGFTQKVLRRMSGERVVVHSHYWDGAKAGLIYKALSDRPSPLIWTPHSLGSIKQRRFPMLNNEVKYNFTGRLMWERLATQLSEAVIVSSHSEKQELIDYYGADPEEIIVMPPGLDNDRLVTLPPSKARKLLNLPTDKLLIGTLGRLTPSKAFENLLNAASLLKKDVLNQLRLVIFAGNPQHYSPEEKDYLKTLLSHAQSLGLSKYVKIKPAVPYCQVAQIYSALDILVHTAPKEPFGLTIIEGMASGLPVILDQKSGAAMYVKDGHSGYLTDIDHPQAVSHILNKLIKSPRTRLEIGEAARRSALWTFNRYRRVQPILNLYRKISAKKHKILTKLVQNNEFLQLNLFESNYLPQRTNTNIGAKYLS